MPQRDDASQWTRFDEPIQATALRTVALALLIGTIIFVAAAHRVSWPVAVLVAFWPSFGGHWVELWFLNWLRPRLARSRRTQVFARVVTWLVGGTLISLVMIATARALDGSAAPWRLAWFGGIGFVIVELVAHSGLAARRRPGFFNGLG